MFSLKMYLSCSGVVSQGGLSGNGPSQNSVRMLSSESLRSIAVNCGESGSFIVVDKRNSGSSKIGMVKASSSGTRVPWTGTYVVNLTLFNSFVWSQWSVPMSS